MSANDQYLALLENLKASNVASNSSVLDHYSALIEENLKLLKGSSEDTNLLNKCIKIIKDTDKLLDATRIDKYIDFGKMFKLIFLEPKKEGENIEHLKKIAVNYLNIAKDTKDKIIRILALEIADELSRQYSQ